MDMKLVKRVHKRKKKVLLGKKKKPKKKKKRFWGGFLKWEFRGEKKKTRFEKGTSNSSH